MMQFAVEHAKGLSLRYDAPSPIVPDKNHRIWHEKSPRRWWLRGLGEGLFDVVLVQDEVDEGGHVAHISHTVEVHIATDWCTNGEIHEITPNVVTRGFVWVA